MSAPTRPTAFIVRGSLGSLFIRLSTVGLAFISQMLLARLMGAEQYGLYVYALTALNLLVLVARLGTDGLLTRFAAAYVAASEWGLLRGLRRFTFRLVAIGSALLIFLGIMVLWAGNSRLTAGQGLTYALALAMMPGSVAMGLINSFLIGLKRPWQALLMEPLSRLMMLIAAILAYLWLGQLTSPQVMAISATAVFACALLGTLWLHRAMPATIGLTPPALATREWLGMALPNWVMSFLRLLLGQGDILLLGWMLDEKSAGIYAIASRLAELASFGLQAINTTLAPSISEFHATGQMGNLRDTLTRSARGVLFFTLMVCMGFTLLGDWILGLFGPEFEAAKTCLAILLAGQIFNAITGPVGTLLNMTGHQNTSSRLLAIMTALTLALQLLFIPRYGIEGAASASALGMSLLNAFMWIYVNRKLKINPTAFRRISNGKA